MPSHSGVCERLRRQIVLPHPRDQAFIEEQRKPDRPAVGHQRARDGKDQYRVNELKGQRRPLREPDRVQVRQRRDDADAGKQGRPLLVDIGRVGHPPVSLEGTDDSDVLVDPGVLRSVEDQRNCRVDRHERARRRSSPVAIRAAHALRAPPRRPVRAAKFRAVSRHSRPGGDRSV